MGGSKRAGANKDEDEEQLESRGDVLKLSAEDEAAQVDERRERGDGDREEQGRGAGSEPGEVFGEGHGRERDGCGESDRDRQPARQKTHRRMINARQVVILSTGA